MRLVTWNVNGIRARWGEVVALVADLAPDVLCLQEIKAVPSQVPEPLTGLPQYWNTWHGGPKGYSGVSVHVRRDCRPTRPRTDAPAFDFEHRIVTADLGTATVASVYVPNGNKDHAAKLRFLRDMRAWVEAGETPLVIAGDLNVALTDADVHPRMREPGAIGQREDERALLEGTLATGLVDLVRVAHPASDDREPAFTWWPPWRDEKAKNRGWRIDFVLASSSITAGRVEILADRGTSDHAPVLAELDLG